MGGLPGPCGTVGTPALPRRLIVITLHDLLHEVLPEGVPADLSAAALDRDVTWATRPRPSPPAFAHLSGGELVLLRQEDLTDVDDRLTLDVALRQLARFGVVAVAFAGAIAPSDRQLAADRDVVLIAIPSTSDLVAIETHASQVIAERRRDRQRRGHEAGRRLMELAIAGEPLAAIIRTLATVSGQAVALESRDGRILTYFSNLDIASREAVEPMLAATGSVVQNWLAVTSDASPAEPPTMHMALGAELDRTIAPVIGREGLLGCLSLIGPSTSWSGEDNLITSRGAAACAIVLAREFASIAVRREIELNVLDEVLDGALRNETTLLQQARRLGHDLEAEHRIIVCRFPEVPPSQVREGIRVAFSTRGLKLLWRIKATDLEIVVPPSLTSSEVMQALLRELPNTQIQAGGGRTGSGLTGLQRSHSEAHQALIIQQRLTMDVPVAEFGDLGIYRLLFAAEPLPEFAEFHDNTLGLLVAHDAKNHSEFVSTLRAFFAANGSPKEASEQLGVHRNTVLYRLGKIAALTGYQLDDAATRLHLQLALSIDTIQSSRQRPVG